VSLLSPFCVKMATPLCRHLLRHTSSLSSFLSRDLQKFGASNRSFSVSKYLSSYFYTKKHEWVKLENGTGTVGISDYAQVQLGDIVYVEFPEVGAELEANEMSGCLESVKAASEVYCPVNGTVSEVNSALEDTPGLVNQSPLTDGWLFKMKVASDVDTSELMDTAAYEEYVGTLEEH